MMKFSICFILISYFTFATAFKGTCHIYSAGGGRALNPHPTSWRLMASSASVPWVIDEDGKIGWSGGVMCAFGNGEIFVYDRNAQQNKGPNCKWNLKKSGAYYTIENQQYKGSYIGIYGQIVYGRKKTRLDSNPEHFQLKC
uniref:Secreted salivary protein n=1 Tax=Culicoides nubeculosus TaxID=144565 RepID=B9URI8_CULNU|nr:secreted salivary protein [Culicoides nubeculosus]